MTRARAAGLAAGILLLACSSPARSADVHRLLRQSFSAERRLTYQGTKLLTRTVDGQRVTTTARVYHRAPDRTLMVGVSGDLAGARVLELGRQHFVKKPGQVYRRTPLPVPVDSTDLLVENYRPRQMRVEPIAGRRCMMVALEPRHPGNPHKIVWLDLNTGLALKTQIWSARDELTEESMFLRIQLNPRLSSSLFALPREARREEWPEVPPDFEVLAVPRQSLPLGYRLVETSNRRVPRGGIVSFQRYSDGLNTLTVLQSKTHRDLDSLGGRPAVRGQVGTVRFVICGEQDAGAIRRMSRAIQGQPLSTRGSPH